MSTNSINIGFDMESHEMCTQRNRKSWFCIWQGENHIWPMQKYFTEVSNCISTNENFIFFTYLLWIFLQKNWTSFSLFSSWSSMNLKKKKELQLNQMKIMRIMNEWKSDSIIWCLHKGWKLLNFCSILCQRWSDRPIGRWLRWWWSRWWLWRGARWWLWR